MNPEGFQQAHALLAQGRIDAAQALFASLSTESEADALNGLGLCAEAKAQLPEAEVYYRQALALNPEEAEFHNNLAICLINQGKLDGGLQVFRNLAELKPEPEVLYNLVLALMSLGRPWDALDLLKDLLELSPRQGSPIFLLMDLIEAQVYQPDSLTRLRDLLAQAPDQAAYHLALGAWYDLKGQSEMAVRYFRSALLCNPQLLGAYRHLIHQYQARGQYSRALETARRMFTSEASLGSLIELVISMQHPIPESDAQIAQLRQELSELLDSFTDDSRMAYLREREFYRPSTIPFYQSYQQGSDLEVQQKLAGFFSRFLKGQTLDWRPNPKPRIGIFSVHLYRHSVMDLLLRAMQTLLQSNNFESYLFFFPVSQNDQEDAVTQSLREHADHFFKLPEHFIPATEIITAQNLDLLIFLDVGMDSYSYSLALNRLARFQLVLPGHPVTTGMSTMDYFISAEALEGPDGDQHYSEQLIHLPGLPDYQRPEQPEPATREELGLPPGNLYLCPMTPFKMLPAFDRIVAGILQADPQATVLMLEYRNALHLAVHARFARSFPQLAGRLQFLPWARREVFYQRLQVIDVMLDTFPFGGGNTAYQALGLGCPIVCLDVPWQKGRWTQAMYKLMGMDELVARDPKHYVELAVRVATDKTWQQELRAQIAARSAVLFDNPAWSEGLLHFCRELVTRPA